MSPASRRRVCLVEAFAHWPGGHTGDNLVQLCEGAADIGVDVTIVAVQGVAPRVRDALKPLGPLLVDQPAGWISSVCLWMSVHPVRRVQNALAVLLPKSRLQVGAGWLRTCLTEIVALRTATKVAGARRQSVVMLTASDKLAATVATLSGTSHVRFVHRTAPGGRLLRAVDHALVRGARKVVVVCTTEKVETEVRQEHPELQTLTRTFTLADPRMYIGDDERAPARRHFDIDDAECVVAIVGAWRPDKDFATVERALRLVRRPVTLIVAGTPSNPRDLEPAVRRGGGRIIDLQGAVGETKLRCLYAASDCSLVTRVPGWTQESGQLYDAVRYGVPVIVTDHNSAMSELLADEEWVRVIPSGSAEALARAIEQVAEEPLPRPDRDATRRFGLHSPSDQVAVFLQIADTLP